MKEAIRLIRKMVDSGRLYGKRGLLYEAAYRYGQAVAMMNMLYLLHKEEVLTLDPAIQSFLAQTHEKLAVLSISLGQSAGNGRHKMGDTNSDAKESLLRVVDILKDDIDGASWAE